MVKKELPKRVFKRGKKPLGKTSGKVREKKEKILAQEIKESKFVFEFPNIHLFFAESKKQLRSISGVRYGWIIVIAAGILLCLWQLWVFVSISPQFFHLISERTMLEAQLHTWESLGNRYTSYRDAHFESALLAYRLGKKDVMDEELKKVLEIDPNFALVQQLQKEK